MADVCEHVQPGPALLQSLLSATDCHSKQFAIAPFAATNAIATYELLTFALTMAVLLFGYGLMSGRLALSATKLTNILVKAALLIVLTTQWASYAPILYDLLGAGPEHLGMALVRAGFSSSSNLTMVEALQRALNDLTSFSPADPAGPAHHDPYALASSYVRQPAAMSPPAFDAFLLLMAAGVLGGAIIGILLVSKLLLATLFVCGPVFLLFGLITPTRGLALGWLRASVAIAATPIFAVLALAIALQMLEPTLSQLEKMNSQGFFIPGAGPRALLVALIVGLALIGAVAATTWAAFKVARGRLTDVPTMDALPLSPRTEPARPDRLASLVSAVARLDRTR